MADNITREIITTPEESTIETVVSTTDSLIAKREDIFKQIVDFTHMSARAYTDPKFEPTYEQIGAKLKNLKEVYDAYSRHIAYAQFASAPNPMLAACTTLTYPKITIKEKSHDGGGGRVRSYEYSEGVTEIDLRKFADYCGGEFAHGTWRTAIEKLGNRLAMKAADGLGIPPAKIKIIDDSYNMSKMAREFEFAMADETGSTPNPLSKTQMLKNLTAVLSYMFGDEKYVAELPDVNFLIGSFSSMGRSALQMRTARANQLFKLIGRIAYRVINGYEYELDADVKRARK